MTSNATIDPRFLARWSAKVRAKGERIHELEEQIAALAGDLHARRLELRTLRADLEALSRSRVLEADLFEEPAPEAWPKLWRDVPIQRIGLSYETLQDLHRIGIHRVGQLPPFAADSAANHAPQSRRDEIANRVEFLFAEHPEYAAQRDAEEDAAE